MSLSNWNPEELALAARAESALLVELWAEWCPQCRVQAGMLERLEPEFTDRLRFGRLDHGAHPGIAEQHGVRSLPTLLLYRDGEVREIVQGFKPAAALRETFEKFLAPASKKERI